MSRFMQIRIQLQANYRPDLRAHFPRLAAALEEIGVSVDERRVTLYHLVREVQRALYWEIDPALKRVFEQHRATLVSLQGAVEEKLAAWRLDGLDALLYRLEDAFEDLERDLA